MSTGTPRCAGMPIIGTPFCHEHVYAWCYSALLRRGLHRVVLTHTFFNVYFLIANIFFIYIYMQHAERPERASRFESAAIILSTGTPIRLCNVIACVINRCIFLDRRRPVCFDMLTYIYISTCRNCRNLVVAEGPRRVILCC